MTIWKDSAIARRMRITSTRTVETMDMTAMDAMAAAATETTAEGTMAAYLPGVAVTTTMWRRWWPQKTQPAMRGTQARVSNCQAGARGRLAGQTLRWQAGQARISRFHLQTPAARSCWSCWSREELASRRSLGLRMLSRSLCLWPGTPVAIERVRCRVRWCDEAKGSGRRASGAGGAQKAGSGAPPSTWMFQSLQSP